MKFEEFKEELRKQIGINSKYFKNLKEKMVLQDFLETIDKKDFKEN